MEELYKNKKIKRFQLLEEVLEISINCAISTRNTR